MNRNIPVAVSILRRYGADDSGPTISLEVVDARNNLKMGEIAIQPNDLAKLVSGMGHVPAVFEDLKQSPRRGIEPERKRFSFTTSMEVPYDRRGDWGYWMTKEDQEMVDREGWEFFRTDFENGKNWVRGESKYTVNIMGRRYLGPDGQPVPATWGKWQW